eukprot:jgi/Tetstr1/442556/TSEL_030654.t1
MKPVAALTGDYRVSGSGAVFYSELSATFHTTPYSGFNSAFKAAYARAFRDPATRTTVLDRVGSHSGRKSLAQWLWDRYSGVFTDTDVT